MLGGPYLVTRTVPRKRAHRRALRTLNTTVYNSSKLRLHKKKFLRLAHITKMRQDGGPTLLLFVRVYVRDVRNYFTQSYWNSSNAAFQTTAGALRRNTCGLYHRTRLSDSIHTRTCCSFLNLNQNTKRVPDNPSTKTTNRRTHRIRQQRGAWCCT